MMQWRDVERAPWWQTNQSTDITVIGHYWRKLHAPTNNIQVWCSIVLLWRVSSI
jgi:hypothetical protein